MTLAWAKAGDNDRTLANSLYNGTSANRNFAHDDDNGGAFVRYGGASPSSKPDEEDDRIIDGNVAEGDQFGFMAFVYYNQDKLSDVTTKSCSATVIDGYWLLTAAHCLTSHDGTEVNTKWS